MIQNHLALIDFLLEGSKPVRYTKVQDRLYLDFDWRADAYDDQYIVIHCWRALDPNNWNEIYNAIWLKKYTTARIKRMWGQNLTKYKNVQLPGGAVLSGEMIYNDAVEQIKLLEEELELKWQEPPLDDICLLYTSPSPRDRTRSRMPSSA